MFKLKRFLLSYDVYDNMEHKAINKLFFFFLYILAKYIVLI